MPRWIGSNEHQFNVGGKSKCEYCGLYFLDHTIGSHEEACHHNPDNKED